MAEETFEDLMADEAQVTEEIVETEASAPVETVAPETEKTGEIAEAEASRDASPPDAENRQGGNIPIAAHLAERDKRQEAERRAEEAQRRAEEIERRLQAMERQSQQSKQAPVDLLDMTPEQQQYHYRNQELNTYEEAARMAYGDQDVDAFIKWALSDPSRLAEFQSDRNPYRTGLARFKESKEYKEAAILAEIGEGGLDAYRERILAEAQQQAPSQAPVTPAPQVTPPSLAKGGAAGSAPEPVSDDDFLRSVFDGR